MSASHIVYLFLLLACAHAFPIPVVEPEAKIPDHILKVRLALSFFRPSGYALDLHTTILHTELTIFRIIICIHHSQFAMRAIRMHFKLDAAWDYQQLMSANVETSRLTSTRMQLKQVDRQVIDRDSGEMRTSQVLDYVPVDVHHRIDTEYKLTIEMVRDVDAAPPPAAAPPTDTLPDAPPPPLETFKPFVIEVGVSHDANNYLSLTRLSLPHAVNTLPSWMRTFAQPAAVGRVRVLNANLWNFNFFLHRRELLLREIERSRADVIGFQEVRVARESPYKVP